MSESAAEMLRQIYECPSDIQCGPCRRRIGELVARLEETEKYQDEYQRLWHEASQGLAHQRAMKIEAQAELKKAEQRIESLRQAHYEIKDLLDQGQEVISRNTADRCWRIAADAVDE